MAGVKYNVIQDRIVAGYMAEETECGGTGCKAWVYLGMGMYCMLRQKPTAVRKHKVTELLEEVLTTAY